MARIIVGATGSVAAIRTPALVTALRTAGHDARVAATEHALYFFDPSGLPEPDEDAGPPLGRAALFRDVDEWPGKAPSSKLQVRELLQRGAWSVELGAPAKPRGAFTGATIPCSTSSCAAGPTCW